MQKIPVFKKIVSSATLVLAFVSFGIFSYQVPSALALSCPCTPNLAVYPKGNDPYCVGGVYSGPNPSYCSGGAGSINTTGGANSPSGGSSVVCNVSSAKTFKDLVMNVAIGCVIIPSFTILVGLAVVFFLLGVFKYIRSEGDDKVEGRKFILYGIIGLFVMLSVAGLVEILQSTLAPGGSNGYNITPKSINLSNLF